MRRASDPRFGPLRTKLATTLRGGKQRGRATSLPNGTQIRQADIVRLLGSPLVHWFARSVERGGRIRICYTSIDGSLGHKVIPPTVVKRPPNERLCTAVKRMFVVRRERETVRSRWLSDLLARVPRDDNEAPRRGGAPCEPRDWLPTAVPADVAAVKIISPASSFTLSPQQPVSHEEDCSPPQTLHQKRSAFFPLFRLSLVHCCRNAVLVLAS